jgi:hypothetical protein
MGWLEDTTMTMIRYGKQFQKHRRLLHDFLNKDISVSYRPVQIRETGVLLQNLLSDDTKRDASLRRYCIFVEYILQWFISAASNARFVTTVIVHVVCGHQITSDEDPYLKIAENTSKALTVTGSPGGTIIELLPFREFVAVGIEMIERALIH